MAKKKANTADKLEALRKKLTETDMGGSQGFFSPQQGVNEIRILPEVGEMDWFFQTVGRHYLPDKKQVYCPNFTSEGEKDCPVCDFVSELYSMNDEASKDLAGQIRVRKMYWMNVVVREENGTTTGPYIYTPGITVFTAIAGLINDPDYGDIYDVEHGTDVAIHRSGTGLNTEYQVIARRATSPLHESEAKAKEILSKARDLSWVEVSENPEEDKELSKGHAVYILPYDRIVDEMGLDLDTDELLEGLLDEGEEDHPVQQDVKRRRRRRSGR